MAKSDGETPHILWSWCSDEAKEQLPEGYLKRLQTMDECKWVDNNRRLLCTSSSGLALLMEIKSKKIEFYAKGENPHSAAILPNGRIAVAMSLGKGNKLVIFNKELDAKPLFSDSLYSAHGVVWDAERESLFALGYKELREYKLQDWQSDKPSLKMVRDWEIPLNSGHDLTPVGEHQLLISGHEGVVTFDIESESFTPFELLKDAHGVKSVNYDPQSGTTTYTKAEKSWWSYTVRQSNPDRVIRVDSVKIYKARPIER